MRPRRLLSLLAVVALAAALAACDGASGPTAAVSSSPGPDATVPASPAESPEATIQEPSEEPTATEPEPTASEVDPSEEPGETEPASAAADCTGNDDNRKFYAGVAESVDWTLYCPVLPAGWFVDSGEWRAASGGRMEIAYRGPGGARLELHEGAFCAAGTSCVPDGSEVGSAAFGDLDGTLSATSDGGWAVAVDVGEPISYLAVGTGFGQEAFVAATDALIIVGD
jgi:hypothetical protein